VIKIKFNGGRLKGNTANPRIIVMMPGINPNGDNNIAFHLFYRAISVVDDVSSSPADG
jgi:hypothetical protein